VGRSVGRAIASHPTRPGEHRKLVSEVQSGVPAVEIGSE